MSTLTADQAGLLARHAGGWLLAATIVDPDYGISSLKSRAGGCSWPPGCHPELPYNRTHTDPAGIVGRTSAGNTVVRVSFTEIRRWAREVPEPVESELRAVFKGMADERNRTINWCHCPWQDEAPSPHTSPCTRYHPSDDEDQRHRDVERGLDDRQDELVETALGLTDDTPRQLDLFEVR